MSSSTTTIQVAEHVWDAQNGLRKLSQETIDKAICKGFLKKQGNISSQYFTPAFAIMYKTYISFHTAMFSPLYHYLTPYIKGANWKTWRNRYFVLTTDVLYYLPSAKVIPTNIYFSGSTLSPYFFPIIHFPFIPFLLSLSCYPFALSLSSHSFLSSPSTFFSFPPSHFPLLNPYFSPMFRWGLSYYRRWLSKDQMTRWTKNGAFW
jgi:hypothetical protein